jgi:hypothetical protein
VIQFTSCRTVLLGVVGVLTVATLSGAALSAPPIPSERFPDAREAPKPDWRGHVFRLSQDYPSTIPPDETYPWKDIDPRSRPEEYMRAVLAYALEGNDEVDWDGAANGIRKWYNAPWLHWGRNGREFVHGLTYERVSQPGELATSQTQTFQNWAIGYYNARGAYTIGQVWRDPNNPNPGAATFLEGAVSIKLLFTAATVDQVPYLKGSKEWDANIYSSVAVPTNPFTPEEIHTLRLLQIDVAVKDRRLTETGWAFGTFVYNGLLPGSRVWDKVVPVGIMWGNDPNVTVTSVRKGKTPSEQWINPSLDVPFQHLGWAGRLNGPVDNALSSCLSCHSTSQWPVKAPLVPPRGIAPDSVAWMQWFRNIDGSKYTFTPGTTSLDYSLQLASGLSNFHEWKSVVANRGGSIVPSSGAQVQTSAMSLYSVTRGGSQEEEYKPER